MAPEQAGSPRDQNAAAALVRNGRCGGWLIQAASLPSFRASENGLIVRTLSWIVKVNHGNPGCACDVLS